ncbi:phosphomannomutase/phosphoglucomutase [Solidesulfovibrio sp.]|uniref:phosphomannomutase/phosphoglucomutase n=1 Tax=Solidesulfovibrio sp. TaxID=2910990 RepID=UPI002B21E260|nr:phosphomannomutase/phosphoglucomutase [Solidesulfovibrio sp.]MEA4856398.1 phosphomannomutase/phosphoglucomutase [Solidesulfovibrio sp.]
MKPVLPGVFRAYDIRGLVDVDFDPDWVERLGRAAGTFFLRRGHSQAVVGHDCRLTSPQYQARLAVGLAACGLDVTCLGMVATPVFYYGVKALGRKAGIMVTASHNPPEFNGFKVWAGETTIHTEAIRELYDIMAAGEFASGTGVVCEHDIRPSYVEHIAEQMTLPRPVKVVVDGGNGAGGLLCAEVLRQSGAEVVPLFCEPDGRFPNHHPDPVLLENVADLAGRVVETGADFGVGLDGDADRIGVVDAAGRLLYGDQVLAIYARSVLAVHPGATVIGEVKCSHLLYKDIAAHGGQPIMAATGHSLIKSRMRETGALLAGEMSGHMFFADRYYGFDDGLYAAARLAEIVAASDVPLGEMLADWPATVNTPEIRLDCPDAIKFDVVKRAKAHFRERYEVIDVDGVRLTFPDGWGLLRASNTQPVLVLRFEAETPERLAEIRRIIEEPVAGWIAQIGG